MSTEWAKWGGKWVKKCVSLYSTYPLFAFMFSTFALVENVSIAFIFFPFPIHDQPWHVECGLVADHCRRRPFSPACNLAGVFAEVFVSMKQLCMHRTGPVWLEELLYW